MSSGFGANGGVGRCFPFWQEVLACYTVSLESSDPKAKRQCVPVLDDYYECLHHRKEAARVSAMQAAYSSAEAASERDAAPKAGQVRSLGLLDKGQKS